MNLSISRTIFDSHVSSLSSFTSSTEKLTRPTDERHRPTTQSSKRRKENSFRDKESRTGLKTVVRKISNQSKCKYKIAAPAPPPPGYSSGFVWWRCAARYSKSCPYLNLVPRVYLLPAWSERKRPWLGLVTCLPEFWRLLINDWRERRLSVILPLLRVPRK